MSQKLCELDGRFKLATNRKPHIASPMVTWPMTLRDHKKVKIVAAKLKMLMSLELWLTASKYQQQI